MQTLYRWQGKEDNRSYGIKGPGTPSTCSPPTTCETSPCNPSCSTPVLALQFTACYLPPTFLASGKSSGLPSSPCHSSQPLMTILNVSWIWLPDSLASSRSLNKTISSHCRLSTILPQHTVPTFFLQLLFTSKPPDNLEFFHGHRPLYFPLPGFLYLFSQGIDFSTRTPTRCLSNKYHSSPFTRPVLFASSLSRPFPRPYSKAPNWWQWA